MWRNFSSKFVSWITKIPRGWFGFLITKISQNLKTFTNVVTLFSNYAISNCWFNLISEFTFPTTIIICKSGWCRLLFVWGTKLNHQFLLYGDYKLWEKNVLYSLRMSLFTKTAACLLFFISFIFLIFHNDIYETKIANNLSRSKSRSIRSTKKQYEIYDDEDYYYYGESSGADYYGTE